MEQLIRDLNAPQNQGNPEKINNIQRQIQRLQQEPAAWDLGLALLDQTEDVLRFYGALTISIKVSNDWEKDKVGEDRAAVSQLLKRLISSYISIAQISQSDLVTAKLATTLATVFVKPTCAWALPCRHILACIIAGDYIDQSATPSLDAMLHSAISIPCSTAKTLFMLAVALQEEVNPAMNDTGRHHAQTQLSNNATDVWILIRWALCHFAPFVLPMKPSGVEYGLQLVGTDAEFTALTKHVLSTIPLWMPHLPEIGSTSPPILKSFDDIIQMIMHGLEEQVLVFEIMNILTTLEDEDHRLMSKSVPDFLARIIKSDYAKHAVQLLKDGDHAPEAKCYVEFLDTAMNQVDTTTPDFLKHPELVIALRQTSKLLRCEGIAAIEDTTCRPMLDIMMAVTEGFSDWPAPSEFDQDMRDLVRDSCAAILVKIQFPSEELEKTTQAWDDDERLMFEDFRFDAQDFFQTSYSVLGSSLLLDMVTGLKSLDITSTSSRSVLEAVMFTLTALADPIADDAARCDPYLDQVFETPIWKYYVSSVERSPPRVTQALIKFLGEVTAYLKRHPPQMLNSLNLLFASLQVKGLSTTASKAIYNLCDSERSALIEALPQFVSALRINSNLTGSAKYRVFSAVSSIVQALATELAKVEPLKAILQTAWDVRSLDSTDNDLDPDSAKALDLMQMLAAIGKGLQTPPDAVVDLENSESITEPSFWLSGSGVPVQETILNLFRGTWISSPLPPSAELVEASCEFLRCGFTEAHPSPFKFPELTSVELLISMLSSTNPNLEQVMSVASAFLAGRHSTGKDNAVEKLIDHVVHMCQKAISSENEPIVTAEMSTCACAIDFFSRLFPKWGLQWMISPNGPQKIGFILEYALLLLSDGDMLPRRWAASFCSSFVESCSAESKMASCNAVQPSVSQMLDAYLPKILSLVVRLLGGECARSEIDIVTEILRKCIAKQSLRSKQILQLAMGPEAKVLSQTAIDATKPEQRTRFIAQVENLRGARKTNEITKQFWLACKGNNFGYIA